jgi:hypothetical protein
MSDIEAAPSQEAEKPAQTGLDLLRAPFPASAISRLPKPTKKQTDDLRANRSLGIRCDLCKGWHHRDVVHLDYVGHAAITDRLLECDPTWNWEPVSYNADGSPAIDGNGGMWIRLTVCGVTRLGYGDADGKRGGNAVKEIIGDAIRNAAMRFGAALDLWHKGDLHPQISSEPPEPNGQTLEHAQGTQQKPTLINGDQFIKLRDMADAAGVDHDKVAETYGVSSLNELRATDFARAMKKLAATITKNTQPPPNAGENPYINNQYQGADNHA